MQSDMFSTEPEVIEPSGSVNAYPTAKQLESIAALPFSYDLTNELFRAYWTARTGVSWTGGSSAESACIVDVLIDKDRNDRSMGQMYWPRKYQHVWNVWMSQGRPDYRAKLNSWLAECEEAQKRRMILT